MRDIRDVRVGGDHVGGHRRNTNRINQQRALGTQRGDAALVRDAARPAASKDVGDRAGTTALAFATLLLPGVIRSGAPSG